MWRRLDSVEAGELFGALVEGVLGGGEQRPLENGTQTARAIRTYPHAWSRTLAQYSFLGFTGVNGLESEDIF
jgi:hypothetical protein